MTIPYRNMKAKARKRINMRKLNFEPDFTLETIKSFIYIQQNISWCTPGVGA